MGFVMTCLAFPALKRAGVVAAAVLLVACATLVAAQPAVAKYASIVVDVETGRVLHEENADTRNYPASLTKIMTLYMLFDALERGEVALDTRFPVSQRAAGQAPSKLGLKPGESIRAEDAIMALVTKSANDVATVVAEALGETEYKFALDMTKRARALGMRRTTFRNASGLPNRRQLSTARDMSVLGRRIMADFPQFYHYFSRTSFKYNGRTYGNHNNLLGHYSGADGIKTGYTRASGFNLVASVERDGRRILGVVFGGRTSKSRDRHMVSLLDRGFVRVASIPSRDQLVATAAEAARVAERIDARNPFKNAGSAPPIAQGDFDPAAELAAAASVTQMAEEALARSGPWKIQVGAFKNPDSARTLAETAHDKLEDLGEGLSVIVDRLSGKGLYRARLGGIETEEEARFACRVLERRRLDCLAVAPGDSKLARN
ncbi:MAG: D-alanyl-D-alanine carboxypeptidase [Marivibrio sp.]|uniref:D-alanyl-D-alanine carboxypeptidase n=1 Tax=Marivibrio sp. TaxID=2039719 RepID=UPI0032ED9CB4